MSEPKKRELAEAFSRLDLMKEERKKRKKKDEAKELEEAWKIVVAIGLMFLFLLWTIPKAVTAALLLEHIPGFYLLGERIAGDIAEYITGIRPVAEILSPRPVKYILAWLVAGWVIDLVVVACFTLYATRCMKKILIIVEAYNNEHQPIHQQRRIP